MRKPSYPQDPRRRDRQAGAAAVELALVLSFLVLIASGIVEFGRAIWYYDALSKATRDAARLLSAMPAADLLTGVTDATTLVRRAGGVAGVPGFGASGNVQVICHPTNASAEVACSAVAVPPVETIEVRATYPMVLGEWIPFVPIRAGDAASIAITLRPHTTMRYMQ